MERSNAAANTAVTVGSGQPRRCVSVPEAIAITVGIVVGAFIFQAPSLVAGNVSGPVQFLILWVLGGVVSLIGALCYAELATTYPDAGGDYHYVGRAYGPQTAFLYAWARMMVIQTGSIALLAFLIGDYATAALNLGPYSTVIYPTLVVVLLTGLNLLGVRLGTGAQMVATSAVVLGLLLVVFAGFSAPSAAAAAPAERTSMVGLAMVFVLLTYGGWNEAAYLSAEIRTRRGIVWVLLIGIAIITVTYLLVNLAMLNALGLEGLAASQAVAADVMRMRFGDTGARLVSLLVTLAALTTANATIITGARSNYALGRDFPLLAPLGRWRDEGNIPTTALIVQGAIALALVGFGSLSRNGLSSMVEYITPVFWMFFLLTGLSLFVLRRRDPGIERPFRVPLYPLTPILFCATCAYMLWSSLAHYRLWALVGFGVLLLGVPLMLVARRGTGAAATGVTRGFEPVLADGGEA